MYVIKWGEGVVVRVKKYIRAGKIYVPQKIYVS